MNTATPRPDAADERFPNPPSPKRPPPGAHGVEHRLDAIESLLRRLVAQGERREILTSLADARPVARLG